MRRAALLVLALLASLLMTTGTAMAQDGEVGSGGETKSAEVKGGNATCTVGKLLSSISCDITDDEEDSSGVYVTWEAMGESGKLKHENGYGWTEHHEENGLLQGTSGTTMRWKICRDKNIRGDDCSKWVKHAVGPGGSDIELYCQLDPAQGTPMCYLPDHGLTGEKPSSACLLSIAASAAGVAGIRDGGGKATVRTGGKVAVRFVPFVGWSFTILGGAQGVAECND